MLACAGQKPASLAMQVGESLARTIRCSATHRLLLHVPPLVTLEGVPAETEATRLNAQTLLVLANDSSKMHIQAVFPGVVVFLK